MAAKSDGARQQSDRQAGLIKKSACGRESNGAPILGKIFKNFLKKILTKFKKYDRI